MPKKVWLVRVVNSNGKLRYAERGSGHFTNENAAWERYESLTLKGVECKMFVTETNWTEVEV